MDLEAFVALEASVEAFDPFAASSADFVVLAGPCGWAFVPRSSLAVEEGSVVAGLECSFVVLASAGPALTWVAACFVVSAVYSDYY